MTMRELRGDNSTLPQLEENQDGGPRPGIAEYPAQRRTMVSEGSRAEVASGQTAELGWLSHQLEQELDAASLSQYPDIHLFLALNLTDALIKRAVLMRSTVIARQTRAKRLLAQGAEQAKGAQQR